MVVVVLHCSEIPPITKTGPTTLQARRAVRQPRKTPRKRLLDQPRFPTFGHIVHGLTLWVVAWQKTVSSATAPVSFRGHATPLGATRLALERHWAAPPARGSLDRQQKQPNGNQQAKRIRTGGKRKGTSNVFHRASAGYVSDNSVPHLFDLWIASRITFERLKTSC